jgi:hypothetical protein
MAQQRYYPNDTNVANGFYSADFEKGFNTTDPSSAGTARVATVAGLQSFGTEFVFSTASGVPATSGVPYSISLDISGAGANVTYFVYLERHNSTLGSQLQDGPSNQLGGTFSGTGIKTASNTNWDSAAGSTADRFVIAIKASNSNASSQTLTLDVLSSDTWIDATWSGSSDPQSIQLGIAVETDTGLASVLRNRAIKVDQYVDKASSSFGVPDIEDGRGVGHYINYTQPVEVVTPTGTLAKLGWWFNHGWDSNVSNGSLGVAKSNQFAEWLGSNGSGGLGTAQQHGWVHGFVSRSSWSDIIGSPWLLEHIGKDTTRKKVLSYPFWPDNQGQQFGTGVAGGFNGFWQQIADRLISLGLNGTGVVIRPGWEWNGNFGNVYVGNPTTASQFVSYWRNIVNTMRSRGFTGLFDWCPNWSSHVDSGFNKRTVLELAYPGDAYVDVIGIDIYDEDWASSGRDGSGWASSLATETAGLQWQNDFSLAHNKLMAWDEWGVSSNNSNRPGGGDNAGFINNMLNDWFAPFVERFSHILYFEGDITSGAAADHRLTSGPNPTTVNGLTNGTLQLKDDQTGATTNDVAAAAFRGFGWT